MKKVVKQVLGTDVSQKELVVTLGRLFDDLSIDLLCLRSYCILDLKSGYTNLASS